MIDLMTLSADDSRSLLRYVYRLSEDVTPTALLVIKERELNRCPDDGARPKSCAALIEMACSDIGATYRRAARLSALELVAGLLNMEMTRDAILGAIQAAQFPTPVGSA